MISIPELLKEAVEKSDWEIVKDVYKSLTGQEIVSAAPKKEASPSKKRGRPAKQTTIKPQPLLLPIEEPEVLPVTPRPPLTKNFIASTKPDPNKKSTEKRRIAERKPITIENNREPVFIDDGKLAKKDSKRGDPQLAKLYGVTTTRQPRDPSESTASKVNVECCICGLKEKVSPILAINYDSDALLNRYKCNECLSKPIRK